jgi:hypothetical protein
MITRRISSEKIPNSAKVGLPKKYSSRLAKIKFSKSFFQNFNEKLFKEKKNCELSEVINTFS